MDNSATNIVECVREYFEVLQNLQETKCSECKFEHLNTGDERVMQAKCNACAFEITFKAPLHSPTLATRITNISRQLHILEADDDIAKNNNEYKVKNVNVKNVLASDKCIGLGRNFSDFDIGDVETEKRVNALEPPSVSSESEARKNIQKDKYNMLIRAIGESVNRPTMMERKCKSIVVSCMPHVKDDTVSSCNISRGKRNISRGKRNNKRKSDNNNNVSSSKSLKIN